MPRYIYLNIFWWIFYSILFIIIIIFSPFPMQINLIFFSLSLFTNIFSHIHIVSVVNISAQTSQKAKKKKKKYMSVDIPSPRMTWRYGSNIYLLCLPDFGHSVNTIESITICSIIRTFFIFNLWIYLSSFNVTLYLYPCVWIILYLFIQWMYVYK